LSSEISLTPTSYIVLGLLEAAGPSTPYALKQGVAVSVGNFWSLPHSQLYAEPARLARGGYVTEDHETVGRRRKTYAITDKGRDALRAWTSEPEDALPDLRDIALLKVFFGADPATIGPSLIERYRAKIAEYEQIHRVLSTHGGPTAKGPLLTLELGIDVSRACLAYWERISETPDGS
jgi:DNA-binding PadR family transcriptional regulator